MRPLVSVDSLTPWRRQQGPPRLPTAPTRRRVFSSRQPSSTHTTLNSGDAQVSQQGLKSMVSLILTATLQHGHHHSHVTDRQNRGPGLGSCPLVIVSILGLNSCFHDSNPSSPGRSAHRPGADRKAESQSDEIKSGTLPLTQGCRLRPEVTSWPSSTLSCTAAAPL